MNSKRALSPTGDPWLLTPGPLSTSESVKAAMGHDLGSRDRGFIDLNRRVRERLVDIVRGRDSHVCVPLQGSGTFLVESMLGCFVPRGAKLLILVNGAYGERMARICEYLEINYSRMDYPQHKPCDPVALDKLLRSDPTITHVVVVHCETTSGILNPVEALSEVAGRYQRALLIDAMSTFGAVSLDVTRVRFDALVASSNKCLQGVPGLGFCIARTRALEKTEGNARSLSLDLHDQWKTMEKTGQWRFTPPTHCILAFDRALQELDAEGGTDARAERFRNNCRELVAGMRTLGFETFLPDSLQAPIIVTFHMPGDPKFDFGAFYEGIRERGYVIYPGKLTTADSFRIGCIGAIGTNEIKGALAAVGETLRVMDVTCAAPG